mmetsp:Transcript_1936/g.2783  ORF Transcript_1936/g.2783 Transcript_1936/m.2783 type:complete len:376 (-) Transcript_1936:4-1131(-)
MNSPPINGNLVQNKNDNANDNTMVTNEKMVIKYFFANGKPRPKSDFIRPSELLSKIADAKREIDKSIQRSEIIKTALKVAIEKHEKHSFPYSNNTHKRTRVEATSAVINDAATCNDESKLKADNITLSHKDNKEDNEVSTIKLDLRQQEKCNTNSQAETQIPYHNYGINPHPPPTSDEMTIQARKILNKILQMYPEVISDVLYTAAFENLGIDTHDFFNKNDQTEQEHISGSVVEQRSYQSCTTNQNELLIKSKTGKGSVSKSGSGKGKKKSKSGAAGKNKATATNFTQTANMGKITSKFESGIHDDKSRQINENLQISEYYTDMGKVQNMNSGLVNNVSIPKHEVHVQPTSSQVDFSVDSYDGGEKLPKGAAIV